MGDVPIPSPEPLTYPPGTTAPQYQPAPSWSNVWVCMAWSLSVGMGRICSGGRVEGWEAAAPWVTYPYPHLNC